MADEIAFEVTGLDELIHYVEELPDRIISESSSFMLDVGTEILNESQDKVPLEHGILKASGHVRQPELAGDTLEMEVGYGGAAEAYAYAQETREDFQHPGKRSTNPAGGAGKQAHYLEEPAREHFEDFGQRLADHLQSNLGRQ